MRCWAKDLCLTGSPTSVWLHMSECDGVWVCVSGKMIWQQRQIVTEEHIHRQNGSSGMCMGGTLWGTDQMWVRNGYGEKENKKGGCASLASGHRFNHVSTASLSWKSSDSMEAFMSRWISVESVSNIFTTMFLRRLSSSCTVRASPTGRNAWYRLEIRESAISCIAGARTHRDQHADLNQ